MRPPALAFPLFVLVALSFAGCASDERSAFWDGGLMLSGIVNPTFPPVNMTDAAIDQFPPLRELFDEWERDHPPGTSPLGIGAGIDYPYEEGVGIIRAIQLKEAWVNWPRENRVTIANEGRVFELAADKPHLN